MRFRFTLVFLICSVCWWQEGKGRVLNKDNESLVTKLERKELQRELRNIRGNWDRTREAHNESSSVEEQEAILFRYVLLNLLHTLQRSIRVVSSLIRICGDTFAGVLSGVVKATGGLLSLTANVFWFVSAKLELHQPAIAPYLGNVSTSCASGLRHSAALLRGLGEACIWSGEILETMTLGLGEAVQDSFWGLEVMSNSSNVLVQFLLQIEENTSTVLDRASIRDVNIVAIANNSSTATVSGISSRRLTDKHKSDILHKLHADLQPTAPGLHEPQHHNQHREGVDARLGREWIAPADQSAITSGDGNTETDDIDLNEPTDQPTYQYTQHTAPHSSQHNNNHNNKYSNDEHRQAGTVLADIVPALWTFTEECYIFCVQHLPSLLPQYTATVCAASQQYVQSAIATVLQLYATIAAIHALDTDVPSQGLFFLFAVVAVFVLSIAPFYSIRVKLLTVAAFCVLVYVSFVTTEGIQRSRLVQQSSVRAAHDLLRQQAQQRSRRHSATTGTGVHNTAGYPYTGVDSVYDTYDTYDAYIDDNSSDTCSSDGYIDMASLQLDGTAQSSACSADSTGTADKSSEGSEQSASTSQHTATTAGSAHTAQSTPSAQPSVVPSVVPNTQHTLHKQQQSYTDATLEELLHFDDAIWLNTALSALWEVLDANFSTGGLGPYISDMYADMVNVELSKVPPGVANVRLKSFELGRASPLFKGVRVIRARNHTCLQQLLYHELHTPVGGTSRGSSGVRGSSGTATAATGAGDSTRSDSGGGFNISAHENFLSKLWHFIDKRSLFAHTSNTQEPPSTAAPDPGDNESWVSGSNPTSATSQEGNYQAKSGEYPPKSPQQQSASRAGQPQRTTHSTSNRNSPSYSRGKTGNSKEQQHRALHLQFLNQFSAQCDRLILEMDIVYASADMGIELSLRSNDLKTLVPEVSVMLSELHLAGQMRLNVSLSADYPFLGDGHLSFLSAPALDFSISSFGGLELSSVPYAYYWVNASMHWLLEQYTAPHYTTLDLRHTVCPRCDLPQVPIHTTLREVLLDTLQHAQSGLKNTLEQAVFTAQQTRRLLTKLHSEAQRLVVRGKEVSRKVVAGLKVLRHKARVLADQALLHIQRAERSRHKSLPSPSTTSGTTTTGKSSGYTNTITETWKQREARRAAELRELKRQQSLQNSQEPPNNGDPLHFAWYKGFDYVDDDMLSSHSSSSRSSDSSDYSDLSGHNGGGGGAGSGGDASATAADKARTHNKGAGAAPVSPLKRLQSWAADTIRRAVVMA